MLLEGLVIPISFDTGLLFKGIELIKDAITGVVDKSAEWADTMDRLGDVTGMETDQLAAWSYVTQKAGVNQQTFARGLVILEKGLVKADGSLDTMGKTLQEYGVNVLNANGSVKDQSQLMGEIADKYASFSTQQERVNFLTAVFGRSGADLVDVFDTLAQEGGIDAVTQKVQALGLVMDPGMFENINRALNETGLTFTGLANTLVNPALPAIQGIIDKFNTFLQSDWIVSKVKTIGDAIGTLADDINQSLASGDWTKFQVDLSNITAQADHAISLWVQGLDYSVQVWVAGGGPQRVTHNLLDWMYGVGTGPEAQSATAAAVSGLMTTLKNAFFAVDWNAIWTKFWNNAKEGFRITLNAFSVWAQEQITSLISRLLGSLIDGFFNATSHASGNFLGVPTYSASNASGGGGNPTKRASGGSAGGLTWVGEQGPELLNLPNGSYVNSNKDSQTMQQIDYDQMGRSVALHLVPALQSIGIG